MNKKFLLVFLIIVALLSILIPSPIFASSPSPITKSDVLPYSVNTTVNTDIGGTVPEYEYTMTISPPVEFGVFNYLENTVSNNITFYVSTSDPSMSAIQIDVITQDISGYLHDSQNNTLSSALQLSGLGFAALNLNVLGTQVFLGAHSLTLYEAPATGGWYSNSSVHVTQPPFNYPTPGEYTTELTFMAIFS
jgi:hypothetical protein